MKQNKTLHQIAQRLKRKELIKYASNLHIEFDEKWDTSKLCEVYTQYILSHPKELLLMLPKTDLDISNYSAIGHDKFSKLQIRLELH